MTYDDYLKQSGILGMKWGHRNGPPYPLLRRNMSSAEKKANPASSGNSGSGESGSKSNKSEKPPIESKSIKVSTTGGDKTVPNSKPVRKMSDQELKDSLKRLRDEKEYRDLIEKDPSKGRAFIKTAMTIVGATTISGIALSVGNKLSKVGSKYTGQGIEKAENWIKDVVDLFKNGVFDEKKKD